MEKSTYLKIWLLGFLTCMSYHLYSMHILGNKPSGLSELLFLIVGIVFYIGGFYFVDYLQVKNNTLLFKVLLSVSVALIIGLVLFFFQSMLITIFALFIWFMAAILVGKHGSA